MIGRCRRLIPTIVVLLLALAPNAVAQKSGQPQPMCQSGCLGTTSVSVTPDGGQVTRVASSGNTTAAFTVHNTSSQLTLVFVFSCSATGGMSCVNVSPSSASIPAGDEASVTVTYSVGSSPGTVTLTAYDDTYGATDTGDDTIHFPGPPAATLANYNGDNQDRSLCLTAGAGYNAAFQCGDLMVAHAMPGYATMGRERAPTLIFNTSQSAPVPFAHVQITLGGTQAVPDSVYVALQVNGGGGYITRRTGTWNGWGAAGSAVTREIGMAYTSGESSGAYPFRIVMQSIFNGIGSYADTVAGKFLVVNRSASVFGRGWSLAGLEWIQIQADASMFWAGGDGSAKLYARMNDTLWQAPAGGFRDTLVYHADSNQFARTLRHGVVVTYDAGGRHIRTTNRAGQVTRFYWTTSPERLDSISVPPGGAGTVYRLAYDGNGYLDRITDPAGRVLDATVSGGKLIRLTDPDTLTTYLQYDAGGNITKQLARRRDSTATGWTNYAYAYGIHLTQASLSLDSASTSYATTDYRAWDEKDLGANGGAGNVAAMPDSLYTGIYGPRVGVADDARFWVNRYGAPVKLEDALGSITTIAYDATNTALPATVTYPNGRIVVLGYSADGHANLTSVRDSTAHLTYGLPTAVQQWTYGSANAKDSPDAYVGAEQDTTRYTYTSLGLTATATIPNGHTTQFDYVTTGSLTGMLQAVTEISVPAWDSASKSEVTANLRTAFALNALGNVVADTSPMGRVSLYTRDSVQRVETVFDPAGHRTDTRFDILNRPVRFVQFRDSAGYNATYFPADSGVSKADTTSQVYTGDVLTTVLDPRAVPRSYGYDAANRPVSETDEASHTETRFFNAAGLTDSIRRRSSAVVRFSYDAAGRLTRQTWPTGNGPGADSVKYTYTPMSQVDTALVIGANKRTVRTFYPNGLVRTDQQPNVTHLYGYDRAGKRLFDRIGGADSTTSDSVAYHYDAIGNLSAIWVRWRTDATHAATRDSVRLRWDAFGRRDSVVFSNGARIAYAYDKDGMLRLVCGYHTGGVNQYQRPDHFDLTMLNEWVDADAMIRQQSWSTAVTGCGRNADEPFDQTARYSVAHQLLRRDQGAHSNAYVYDGSGNVIKSKKDLYIYTDTMATNSNRLERRWTSGTSVWQHYDYTPDGGRDTEYFCNGPLLNSCTLNVTGARQYLYDGLGRMAGTNEYACQWVDTAGGCTRYGSRVSTYCTFDADGRLIDTCDATTAGSSLGYDGANVVRTGNDGATAAWTVVQGPGTDDPLLAYDKYAAKRVYFVGDGAGRTFEVVDADGEDQTATTAYFFHGGRNIGANTNSASFGSIRQPSGSMPGLSFFRNRVYDQATGRWTQEDPAGVAGGVNLYQFNGNNPASYTDPYGLCKVDVRFSPVLGGAAHHAYIVTTAPDNTRTYFRGGPSKDAGGSSAGQVSEGSGGSSTDKATSGGSNSSNSGNSSSPGSGPGGEDPGNGPWGNIATESDDYEPGTVDYDSGSPPSVTVVNDDKSCDGYNKSFKATLNAISQAHIPYNPFTTNSNATVGTMLRRAGTAVPGLPAGVKRAPGLGRNLLP